MLPYAIAVLCSAITNQHKGKACKAYGKQSLLLDTNAMFEMLVINANEKMEICVLNMNGDAGNCQG